MSVERYMECIGIAMDALRTGDAATVDAAANLAREVRIGSRWIDEQRDALVEMVDAAGPDGLDRDSLSADADALVPGLVMDGRIACDYDEARGRWVYVSQQPLDDHPT
jgi:hypothetical protein